MDRTETALTGIINDITAQTALQAAGAESKNLPALPSLPAHYNPIRALGKEGKAELARAVLTHYEAGRDIWEIAAQLQIHPRSVYRLVVAEAQEEWQELIVARYQAEVEDAERELKTAPDTLVTTRARERLASARWHLERLNRRIYGQQESGTGGAGVSISINLGHTSNTERPAIDVTPLNDKD